MQRIAFNLLLLLLFSCHVADDKRFFLQKDLHTNSQAQILNNIVVHEQGGLEVARAFLAYEDGTFVNNRNAVNIGDVVCLNLVVKGGWMAAKDSVSIGATETITTDNGEPVLSSPDLFATTPKIAQARAAQLQVKATVTKARADNRGFVVAYSVWDKMGPGKVSGYYRLQLANTLAK